MYISGYKLSSRELSKDELEFKKKVLNMFDDVNFLQLEHKETSQTEKFFRNLTRLEKKSEQKNITIQKKNSFENSSNQIIHYGCGNGLYLNKFSSRKIIGYDFSGEALDNFSADNKKIARAIDLEELEFNPNDQAILKEDHNLVSDILMIRVLEYLKPEAVIFLLHFIIENAKPGSCFYIETFNNDTTVKGYDEKKPFYHKAESNLYASFFGGRTDYQFKLHNIAINEPQDSCSGPNTECERLVVVKR